MKILKRKNLAALLVLSLLASLLPLGAQPALAAAPENQVIYVGNENVTSGGYWTTDSNGNVTAYTEDGTTPSNNYIHYDKETNTLTLHNATIKESLDYTVSNGDSSFINSSAIGVLNQQGNAELTIQLEGSNTIAEVSQGIYVLAHSQSTGSSSLTITGKGSLDTSGSQFCIRVQSNSSDAALSIENAKVTATVVDGYGGKGVFVQSSENSSVSLTVNSGSLTATGRYAYDAGILLQFGSGGSGSGSGKPTVTVSGNAVVDAKNGGIANNSSSPIQYKTGSDSTGGIVWNGSEGTVYGEVILQDDLTIGEDESLTLDNGASLNAGGHNVIVDGGTLNGSLAVDLKDSVKYTPTITTERLVDGRVGEPYSASLGADGTAPITWSVTNGSLPTGLSLKGNTISGTPTTAGTSTFTVTATNTVGSDNSVATDSKQFTLTIEAATDVSVESVSLNKTTLELTEGSTETLTATITPNNATNQNVTWKSSNPSVATVDESGKVTAIAPGEATITATAQSDKTKSATCTVTVHTATTITTQPQSVSVTEGQSATFSVAASGDNLRYQWQINSGNGWSDITGATDASYTIDRTTTAMSGNQYRCIVTGDGGETTSSAATLTVRPYDPPYTGKYSYEIVSDVGENGTIDVDRYATEGDQVTITVSPDEAYLLDDLTVTSGGKDVALTDNGDGTYTFTMPSADVKITATFAEDPDWSEPEEPVTDVSDIFLDIAPNAWYKDAVQYAYAGGLMTGVSANEFAPEQTTTRAMIVSMLARLEGVESANNAGFADVSNEWYATAVNWAANVGVVNGYEDSTFRPNTAITREQLAAILMNYAQYKGQDVSSRADLNGYTDQPSTWATEAMQWAVAEGLITGVTNDELQPQSSATRAQVAAILQRFLCK